MKKLNWLYQPISAFALSMLLALNLFLYLFWYIPTEANLMSAQSILGSSLARSLAFDATSAVHKTDRAILSSILDRFADEDSIYQASIDAIDSKITLKSRTKNSENIGLQFQAPIHFGSDLLGHAIIQLDNTQQKNWHSQVSTSWILFNLISFGSLAGLVYWRTISFNAQWQPLFHKITQQLPMLSAQLSGSPENQMTQLIHLIADPIEKQGQLMKYMNRPEASHDTERLLEQMDTVTEKGSYQEVALLAVHCQNWEELIRIYSAPDLQEMWHQYETLMIRVSELYSGVLLPDGFSLAFGLNESEHYAFDALCAARVIQLALAKFSNKTQKLSPILGIAVSAGPALIAKTYKHGIPLPLIVGDADVWLQQLKALQPADQILLAEPILQDREVNQQIEASLLRDVTLRNGQRLEIWEFDRMKYRDDLLDTQAETLVNTND